MCQQLFRFGPKLRVVLKQELNKIFSRSRKLFRLFWKYNLHLCYTLNVHYLFCSLQQYIYHLHRGPCQSTVRMPTLRDTIYQQKGHTTFSPKSREECTRWCRSRSFWKSKLQQTNRYHILLQYSSSQLIYFMVSDPDERWIYHVNKSKLTPYHEDKLWWALGAVFKTKLVCRRGSRLQCIIKGGRGVNGLRVSHRILLCLDGLIHYEYEFNRQLV